MVTNPLRVIALAAAVAVLCVGLSSASAEDAAETENAEETVEPRPAEASFTSAGAVKLQRATPKVVAGFRMEGAAEVEVVFGDSNQFRARVDRFFALLEAMRATRHTVSRHVHGSLAALTEKPRGRCPTDTLAPHYYRAHDGSQRYRELGAELETHYIAILRLDELGETTGLTPDYRWRVNRVRGLYHSALVDFREMKASFTVQLGKAVAHRHCKVARLLERGKRMDAPVTEIAVNPTKPDKRRRKGTPTSPVTASPVTFFVDNRTCQGTLDVYVDGAKLGIVAANAKAAFQTLAGRHSMCLLQESASATCGQRGTVRTAHIHDGWSISMHCAVKQARK